MEVYEMRRVRFIAMLLALILAFSSAIEVFADENDNQQQYVDNEAEDAGSIGEGYSEDQPEPISQEDYFNGYTTDQLETMENQFFDYWNQVSEYKDWSSYAYYEVNTELVSSNDAPIDRQDRPSNTDNIIRVDYEVVSGAYAEATPTPYYEQPPRGHANPDDEPLELPRGPMNPDWEPTPIPLNTMNPIPEPPIQQIYFQPEYEPVYTTPVQVEETRVVYDIGLEVGRYAFIEPEKMTYVTSSSNTKIINKPERNDRWGFNSDEYYAQANKPGDATLTFTNTTNNHTEVWNVHVYSRPLDFERNMYVVETPKDRDGYITLYLKNFEYKQEWYYDFVYTSSNKKVAYLAGGDTKMTYARFCIPKGTVGSTVITVKDKYGNSEQAVILVQGPKADGPAKPDNDKTDFSALTAKQQKKAVKAVEVDLEIVSNKTGKITLEWDTTANFDLDGYQVFVSGDKGKTFKKKKTIKKASTTKYKYTAGKDGKTYYFKVRGYKKVNGKTVYTEWSDVIKGKFSK
jgi:hypothetical protein